MKRKTEKYFYRPEFWNQLISFAYTVSPKNQQIHTHTGLTTYLGYTPEQLNTLTLTQLLHPQEQKKLVRLEQQLLEFAEYHHLSGMDMGISIIHIIQKANGKYIKVWRRMYPFLWQDTGEALVYSYCMDITPHSHYMGDKISLHVMKSESASFDLNEAEALFFETLNEEVIGFTDRQLEVLRVCSEVDSAKAAAERLEIEIRTLETHLKNARKRIGARRTMDAILYAKEHGWI